MSTPAAPVAPLPPSELTQAERWLLRTLGPDGEYQEGALADALFLAPRSLRRLRPSGPRLVDAGLLATRECDYGHTFVRLTPDGTRLAQSFGPTAPDMATRVLRRLSFRRALRKR